MELSNDNIQSSAKMMKLTESNLARFVETYMKNALSSFGDAGQEIVANQYWDYKALEPMVPEEVMEKVVTREGRSYTRWRPFEKRFDGAIHTSKLTEWRRSITTYKTDKGTVSSGLGLWNI